MAMVGWEERRRPPETERRVASELRPLFEREGIAFVWENLTAESIDDATRFEEGSAALRRRLSIVRAR